MRTTLTIDDDVLAAVKVRAQRERRTVGQVLSDLARKSLTATSVSVDANNVEEFFGFAPLPHRGKPVSNALIDRLRGESESLDSGRPPSENEAGPAPESECGA